MYHYSFLVEGNIYLQEDLKELWGKFAGSRAYRTTANTLKKGWNGFRSDVENTSVKDLPGSIVGYAKKAGHGVVSRIAHAIGMHSDRKINPSQEKKTQWSPKPQPKKRVKKPAQTKRSRKTAAGLAS